MNSNVSPSWYCNAKHPQWGQKDEKGQVMLKYYQAFCLLCPTTPKVDLIPFAEWKKKPKGTTSWERTKEGMKRVIKESTAQACSGGSPSNLSSHLKKCHEDFHKTLFPQAPALTGDIKQEGWHHRKNGTAQNEQVDDEEELASPLTFHDVGGWKAYSDRPNPLTRREHYLLLKERKRNKKEEYLDRGCPCLQ
jgi:hypothetical protein